MRRFLLSRTAAARLGQAQDEDTGRAQDRLHDSPAQRKFHSLRAHQGEVLRRGIRAGGVAAGFTVREGTITHLFLSCLAGASPARAPPAFRTRTTRAGSATDGRSTDSCSSCGPRARGRRLRSEK